jgi:hypothetical protein
VESIVAAGASSDNLSTTVISSEVTPIDSAKSKKTTITSTGPDSLAGATYKAGLLGETEEEQSIVAAGSLPDTLTEDIISSQVIPIDSAKSKKVTVTATGPTTLTAERISERGDTQTITKSIVPASEGVTTDALLLVSSQVDEIDSAKSQKTDTTVASYAQLTTKSKKSGLLGSTSTTDDIVAPTTDPDELSQTIIESSVEAISATKSRKRTTTADGPTQLDSDDYKSGLLGETKTSQSIVAYGTAPDALSETIVSSSVEAIDEYKSRKTTVESTGPTLLSGVATKAGLLGDTSIEESIVATGSPVDALSLTVIQSQVTPIDSAKSKKTTVESTGPTSLTAEKISERGDTQTITKSIVTASTGVTTDSLTLVSSQVDEIDSAKSQKTDVTVASYSQLTTKANKSGLLGNTETTDDIVDPSTYPDQLSTTIIESSVEAISATKSRKRTTTSTGPDSLDGVENKGGLLGETTTTESIVPYGDPADSLSISVIQSSVTPIDEFKSKKITVESTSPTSLTAKKISERGDVQTITKTIVAAATGTTTDSLTLVSSQVDEIDSAKSQKTDVTVSSYSQLTTKSNKAGLLGKVSTTDSIVSPATDPDALSMSIIDSSVEAISATKSRKRTSTASGPNTLSGKSERPGLLGSTTTTETIVAAGASADALTLTRIQSEITPIDEAKSKKTTVDSTGPTQLDGKTIGEFGLVSLEQSIVAYGSALPTPTENTIDLKKEPIDLAKAKLIESSYDSPEVLNGYQYDADLNLIISNTKEIISEGAAPLSFTNGLLAYTDTPINAWQSIRIQSKITSLPTARTEYKTGAYASPNLITGFDTSSVQMPNWDISVNVRPTMRAKRSYQTVFKNVTSYQYGQPNPSFTLYDPISVNVYYDGYFFKMNIPDALTNSGISVSFTTASNDPVHGYVNETFNVPASTESASAYEGKIGSYQLIAFEVDYWKANIWRMVEQYVLLK